jgi:uncharacterized protein
VALFKLIFLSGIWMSFPHAYGADLAKPPAYYVLDQTHSLDQKSLESLEALVIEHDRLTGEQIMLVSLEGAPHPTPEAEARKIFDDWSVGKRGEDNGALVVVFPKSFESAIVVGTGLEASLPEAKIAEILHDQILPHLKEGQVGQAFAFSLLALFERLESPLIASNQATRILRSGGLLTKSQNADAMPLGTRYALWVLAIGFGLVAFGFAFYLIVSAEALFSREGWFRPNPLSALLGSRKKSQQSDFKAGGTHGSW